jgi:hypothetical protein
LSWVHKVFPHDLDGYSSKSLCARFLSTISLSLFFFQYPDDHDRPLDLDSFHKYIAHSNSVLQALPDVIQSPFLEIDRDASDEEPYPTAKLKKVSQKARKSAKKSRQATKSVDPAPFRDFDVDVPTSHHEAKEMALAILTKQKEIFLVIYLYSPPLSRAPQTPLCLVVVPGHFSSRITLRCVQKKLYPLHHH